MTGPVAPEMTRPFPLSRIGEATRFVVEADDGERARLACRMGVPAIHRLTCSFELQRAQGGAVAARGALQARVRQTCVVSLEEFDADVSETFAVRFVPAGQEREDVDLEAEDEVTYEGATLDLGEAASEQLALALGPFPRRPGAALPVAEEAPVPGAFAALGEMVKGK